VDFVHPIEAVIPGAQGRILAVLAQTTAELNLRTLARLAGVSAAQASRVMPELVELGLVERREVPPSSQFRLAREHVAAEAIMLLARSRERALQQLGEAAGALPIPPVAVIVFGSVARGDATPESDLDVVVVRPDEVDADDEAWGASIEQWRDRVRAITGNPVEVVEVGLAEARQRLSRKTAMWADVARQGIVVHGPSVAALVELVDA
jgi:predicted nucleotidyltransferase